MEGRLMEPNAKFLEDEFKRCLSACGFRGYVRRNELGYHVDVEGWLTLLQLQKLQELTGCRDIEIYSQENRHDITQIGFDVKW